MEIDGLDCESEVLTISFSDVDVVAYYGRKKEASGAGNKYMINKQKQLIRRAKKIIKENGSIRD